MIDPDGIMTNPTDEKHEIKLVQIPTCDFEPYDLDDEKSFKTYISDIEKEVRGSFEYRQFINYLRNFMDMSQCAFLEKAHNRETFDIKIEIHHYPFTLYDICNIVYNKREYYHESLEVEMVAKEIMELHYKLIIGLVPLSETVHKLVHNARLFIPITNVLGRYDLFMLYYDPFISAEMKDMINRMEKYTKEQVSELLNTSILDTNNLPLNVKQEDYLLPPIETIGNAMIGQIQRIKDNSYRLPTINDKPMIEDKKEDRRGIQSPIYYLT